MLKYRARIPVKPGKKDRVPEIFRHWVDTKKGDVTFDEIKLDDAPIYAGRFVKTTEAGIISRTDLVWNYKTNIANLYFFQSFQCKDHPYIPFHVPSLLYDLYKVADYDHGIPTKEDPILISTLSKAKVKALIQGELELVMPVVYISTKDEMLLTDPGNVAKHLMGAAHVLVSFEPEEDQALYRATKNMYTPMDGKVTVFLPNRNPVIYSPAIFQKDYSLEKELTRVITEYSKETVYDEIESWEEALQEKAKEEQVKANEAVIRATEEAQEKLRKKAEEKKAEEPEDLSQIEQLQKENEKLKADNKEMGQMIDDEIGSLTEQLKDRNAKLEKLQSENINLRREKDAIKSRMDSSVSRPILYHGTEHDFYTDEEREIILSALKQKAAQAKEGTREKTILDDIVSNNPSSGRRVEIQKEVKNIFRGYKHFTENMENQLNSLGFSCIRDGKEHVKIRLKNDNRYQVAVAKTPSSDKTGDNAAGNVCMKLL